MNITVVIPTRGDRPELLKQCQRLIDRQIRQPDRVIYCESNKGITGNVRRGYKDVKDGIVVIWEDDDYYPAHYLRSVENYWEQARDDVEILGWEQSIYYHLGVLKYRIINNRTTNRDGMSSLMSTTLKAGLNIDWPADSYKWLDIKLWEQLDKKQLIDGWQAIGIKHGIGLCGGKGHLSNFYRKEDPDDPEMEFFYTFTDDEFYRHLSATLSAKISNPITT